MNWIYQSPDKKWAIKQQDDPIWQQIFGIEPEYLICKFCLDVSWIIQSKKTIKECFEWLVKENAISQEEMNNHEYFWGVVDLDKIKKQW
jgi:hypothetical protein